MICGICKKEFEPHHFNQKYCCDECKKEAIRQTKVRYKKTEKGIASEMRWRNSEQKKITDKRYRQSEKGRKKAVELQKRYLEKNPEARERKRKRDSLYRSEGRYKKSELRASAKYRKTEKGKFNRRKQKYMRRALGKIDADYLKKLLEGNICYYCGCEIKGKKTIDHKIPVIKGGTNDNENLVLSCVHCNTQKGSKTEEEYREWLKSQ
jgi:5-methylcytosine-specific restriction endonuclease McrA